MHTNPNHEPTEATAMKLFNIELDEFGQVTCTDEQGNSLFLQMPVTPDSQNTINGEPLDDTYEYAKAIDEYFGKGDRTLARLCYAGGRVYDSYTQEGYTFITDNGDEFVESRYSNYYNVECYVKKEQSY